MQPAFEAPELHQYRGERRSGGLTDVRRNTRTGLVARVGQTAVPGWCDLLAHSGPRGGSHV